MALSSDYISTLAEAINQNIESSLTESVLKRLDSLGYEPMQKDVFAIGFSVQRVENIIKNDCNITEIPEGLVCHAVDMVCGDFLSNMYRTGQLELSSLDLDGALASVTVGGASVSFENGTSDGSKFNTLISELIGSGRGEFACYRTIRW